ncbi:hypothetical protein Syun_023086 [Stephania yunnanensis]|uniref:Aminotransferase-like plant mobile domain-containing protein n=1 Tax=Stephania yunnanensis TaxID=152371 RepID=A0AAP0FAR8_9MAGN
MFITLEDVSILLKILVMRKVVAVEGFSRYTEDYRKEAIQLVSKLLGVTHEEAEYEVNITRGLNVRKAWLKTRWSPTKKPKLLHYHPLQCTARAFLLYLLSCTLFADKSETQVSIALLDLVENLDDVGNYAWGVVALAYLYYQLGSATRVEV